MDIQNAKKTSLFDDHVKWGGKVIDFAGWALPVQYEGIMEEHNAVRNTAGLFDVSHMGEVEVKGSDAFNYIQNLITNDLSTLVDNQVLYTMMCYPTGGVVDDLLVYKFSNDHYYLVINAGNIYKDYKWMLDQRGNYSVDVINISDQISELAIQGPKAQYILQKLTDIDLSSIGFFYCNRKVNIDGVECLVSRTGYTGEDGFEIYFPNEFASKLWNTILECGNKDGIKPCGLGCRDTLRFEVALPLYGNEISEDISPLEACLGFFVKLNKENFIGKDALVKQKEEGLKRKSIGFEMIEKGIPRHGYEVAVNGEVVGFVTTGYFSPSLKKNIGLAIVDLKYTELGAEVEILIRNKPSKAKVVSRKFYNKNYKKS